MQRIVVILIALFVFQSNLFAVYLSQKEGCLEIVHLRDIVELDEDGYKHIIECQLWAFCLSFSQVSELENAHSKRAKLLSTIGGAKLWPATSNGRIVINGIEYTTH